MSGISNFICKPTAQEIVDLCESVTDKNFVTDAEKTQIGADVIGSAAAVKAAIESLAAGADIISADNFAEGTHLFLTAAERALIAAEPQFELLEHEFDVSVSSVWADAIPAGSVIEGIKYINKTVIGVTTATSYKINITGGTTADLKTGILLTKNTKSVVGFSGQACAGTTAVELTPDPDAGSLDTGTIKVGILVRKALTNYDDEA